MDGVIIHFACTRTHTVYFSLRGMESVIIILMRITAETNDTQVKSVGWRRMVRIRVRQIITTAINLLPLPIGT